MTQEDRLLYLIRFLTDENDELKSMEIPARTEDRKRLLRSLMNIRPPRPVPEDFLKVQDAYLQGERAEKGLSP